MKNWILKKRYYRYCTSDDHEKNRYNVSKDDIEELISKGMLNQYLRKDEERQHSQSPRREKTVVNEVKKVSRIDRSDLEFEKDNRKSTGRLLGMVSLCGYPIKGGETRKTMKRKWKEILSVAPTSTLEVFSGRPPITFEDNYLLDGKPNKYIPLLVSTTMVYFEVRRILVDQASSVAIMFVELLTKLGISKEEHSLLRTRPLRTHEIEHKALGYIELMVTYGNELLTRIAKTPFLVLLCPLVHNFIIGGPTLDRLEVVASTLDDIITLSFNFAHPG